MCMQPLFSVASVKLTTVLHHMQQVLSRKKLSKCSCGRNDKNMDKTHCCAIETKYTTIIRCPCLRSGKKCEKLCQCKNLKGNKPSQPRKSRERHTWQKKLMLKTWKKICLQDHVATIYTGISCDSRKYTILIKLWYGL